MYKYYIAIGSNVGKIVANIDKSIRLIKNIKDINILKIAPYYFTPPLLPKNADESYYHVFCNTCIEINTTIEPIKLLSFLQDIEIKMGRKKQHDFWSPRIIDLDIICCFLDDKQVNIEDKILSIPHKEMFNRSFVLDPLSYLNSNLVVDGKSILNERTKLKNKQSVIMGIVNITNNSFSGDGTLDKKTIERKIKELVSNSIPIIDIGCEATNPKAQEIDENEEINRLQTVIDVINKIKKKTFSTKFSIDTYHPAVAEFAVKNGFDIINDVNGFKNERMWQIMQKYSNIEAVIMHSITPHANNYTMKTNDIIADISKWVYDVEKQVEKHNIEKQRIILDYGIGFGKTAFQSLEILKNIDKIDCKNFRVLVGHSKKSFMSLFTDTKAKNRTFETIGSSIILQQKNVDIIRVHDAIELKKTFLGLQNVL